MKRREGWLHYIEIVVLAVVAIPVSAVLSVFLDSVPTPGLYAAMKLISGPIAPWAPDAPDTLIPRLVVAGLVNMACCYVVIRTLVAIVARLRAKKTVGTSGPS